MQTDPLTLLPTQITLGGLQPMSFSYDNRGNLTSLTDAEGRTTTFAHDLMGRVTSQTFPDARTVTYTYDTNGNLTSLTPPGRSAHLFSYDGINQESSYTPPDVTGIPEGHTVTHYHYNRDRELVRIERPDNRNIYYNYNSGGQLNQISLERGAIGYQYSTLTGNLTQITTPEGNGLTFLWDGALPTSQNWQGEVIGSVSQSWDNNLWLSQRCVNTSYCTSFGYDDDGLLTQAGSFTLTRHADHGLVTGTTQGTLHHTYSYNLFGERTGTAITRNGNSVGSLNYSRDKLGRITSRTESLDGSSFTDSYQYDIAGRLIQVTRNGITTTWQYDSNGNRTHENGQLIAAYDEQDRLLSYQGAIYNYTKNGELQSKTESGTTTTYEYDELGNLLQVELPGDITIDYIIDGQSRRIGKKVNGSLTQGFLYQDQLNPIAELDGNGNIVSYFIYADQINVPAYMIKGGNTYQIISDHLGSPRAIVNTATSEVVQRLEYDVWGNITQDTNPGFQPFGFAGGIYDQHTQLTRFGARDYDARSGKWMAKDPIRFEGRDENLYGYVFSDPINFIDPNDEAGIVVGALIGAGLELGLQLLQNGGRIDCVNWTDVVISAAVGAVGAVGAVAPGALTVGKRAWRARGATKELGRQLQTAQTPARRQKLQGRIDQHKVEVVDLATTQAGWQCAKAAEKRLSGRGDDCGCEK